MSVHYTCADALSQHLSADARKGDERTLKILEEIADDEEPEQAECRARATYELGEVQLAAQDSEKAIELFIKAVELGDTLAPIRLGKFCRDGKMGFIQAGAKALDYFTKGATCGNPEGLKLAAEMYRYGQGGLKADGLKAIEFYERLDELDDKEALLNIAEIYAEGCGDLKADGGKALDVYAEIIRHGKFWAEVHRDFDIKTERLEIYERALKRATTIYRDGKGGGEVNLRG